MNNTTETTTKIASSLRRGSVGIKTGSNGTPGGKTHRWNPDTERTGCGRQLGSAMYVHQLPAEHDNTWSLVTRYALCSRCFADELAEYRSR